MASLLAGISHNTSEDEVMTLSLLGAHLMRQHWGPASCKLSGRDLAAAWQSLVRGAEVSLLALCWSLEGMQGDYPAALPPLTSRDHPFGTRSKEVSDTIIRHQESVISPPPPP